MKVHFPALASFLLYASAVIVGDAYSSGSTFQEGLGHAEFFGTIGVVVTFPILVGIGFLLRRVAEWLLRRPLPYRSVLPWFVHVPLSVAILSSVIPDSPETLFRQYVSRDVPSSLSDVRFWRTSGFAWTTVVMSYRLAPSEFSKVLSRYKYAESSVREGETPLALRQWAEVRSDFPISLTASPLVYEYSYRVPGPSGGFHVSHYATKNRDFVITYWCFN